MKLESKKCTVLEGTGNIDSLCDTGFDTVKEFVHESLHKTLIQSSYKYDGKLCYLSGLRWSCVALTKRVLLFTSFRMRSGVPLLLSVPTCILQLDSNSYMQIQYLIFVLHIHFCVIFK